MKTIFVKDIARRLVLEDTINWKKVVPTIVFLGAMFLLGRMAAEVYAETAQTIGSKVLEGENWGLGFGGEGYCTFTIASRTGEGLTSTKSFTKSRRCVMSDSLCIR